MNDVVIVESLSVQDQRAHSVKAELDSLQDKTADCVFDVCGLLLEAHTNSYHMSFGFARFNDWLESTPSMDLSPRQAAYFINIAKKAELLEVDRATLKRVKMTKLKEIFSLDPTVHKAEMLALLEEAEAMTLKEVQYKVQCLKTEDGQDVMLHMTIKYPESAREVIDIAFERARREIGTSQDANGDQVDPSNGKCVEFICADFSAGAEFEEQPAVPEDSSNIAA